jgi:hypothetical protein
MPATPTAPATGRSAYAQWLQRRLTYTPNRATRIPSTVAALLVVLCTASFLTTTSIKIFNSGHLDPRGFIDDDSPFPGGSINVIVYQRTAAGVRPSAGPGGEQQAAGLRDVMAGLRARKRRARNARLAAVAEAAGSDQADDGGADYAKPVVGLMNRDDAHHTGGVSVTPRKEQRRALLQHKAGEGEPVAAAVPDDEALLMAFLRTAPAPVRHFDLLTRMRSVCSIVFVVPLPDGDGIAPFDSPFDVNDPDLSYAVVEDRGASSNASATRRGRSNTRGESDDKGQLHDFDKIAANGTLRHRLMLFEAMRVRPYEDYLNAGLYPSFHGHRAQQSGRYAGGARDLEEEFSFCPRRQIFVITTNQRAASTGTLNRLLNYGALITAVISAQRQRVMQHATHHRRALQETNGVLSTENVAPKRSLSSSTASLRSSARETVNGSTLLFLDASVMPLQPVSEFLSGLYNGLYDINLGLGDDVMRSTQSEAVREAPRIVGCTITARDSIVSYGLDPVVNAHNELSMAHRLTGYSVFDERATTFAARRAAAVSPLCFATHTRTWRKLGGVPSSAGTSPYVTEQFLLACSSLKTAAFHAELSLITLDSLMRALPFTRPQARLFDSLRAFLSRTLDDLLVWEAFVSGNADDQQRTCPLSVRLMLRGRLFTLLPLARGKAAAHLERLAKDNQSAAIDHTNPNNVVTPEGGTADDDAANDFGPHQGEMEMWQ